MKTTELQSYSKEFCAALSEEGLITSSPENGLKEKIGQFTKELNRLRTEENKRVLVEKKLLELEQAVSSSISDESRKRKIITFECVSELGEGSINPVFTFSAAQTNVVAISIFLAMALRQQCTNLNTILLNDPIQSMDDLNILSFIDVLRSCTSEDQTLNKQFILSTHEDKFFRLIMKKFRYLASQAYYFYTYDENGPRFHRYDSTQQV